MAEIDNIVDVQISRETTQIDTASFDIPLILVKSVDATAEDLVTRRNVYTDLEGVSAGEGIDSNAYQIASKLLGQDLRPTKVLVGYVASDETYEACLMKVVEEDNQWFVLVCEDHTTATQLALASAIQGMRKIYGTSTQDIEVTGAIGEDIGSQLYNKNYNQTFIIYSANADTDFPEAAWIGGQIPEVAGSNTWTLKQGAAVTVDTLSDTQRANLRSKQVNMFTRVAGVSVFQDGVMADGSWIDEIIFIMWCEARIKEAIFFRLLNSKKVPMTRTGATIIENEIRSILNQGVRQGGIADDTPYYVEAPDPMQMNPNDRAKRALGDFKFEFRLAGAVHSVKVRGVATV